LDFSAFFKQVWHKFSLLRLPAWRYSKKAQTEPFFQGISMFAKLNQKMAQFEPILNNAVLGVVAVKIYVKPI
jgi:hypothetical protein